MLPPKQRTLLTEVEVARAPAGCEIVAPMDRVQLFASVTVTVLAPALSPAITEVVAAVDQRYVYGEVPPDAVTVAAPVLPPKQRTLLTVVEVARAPAGCEIVAPMDMVQLFASVTVTVLAPALSPVITEVVAAVDQR